MNTGETLRNQVAIAGVGESEIGKVPHMSGLGLNAQAAKRALEESGLKLSDIDGVLTCYNLTEPYPMLGTVLCEYLGIKPKYCAAMMLGGASPAVVLRHAAETVASGRCKAVLVCGGENRATGLTRDQAVQTIATIGHPYFESPYGPSMPGFYALIAQRYMHEYGLTLEQLAAVAVTTRRHAALHPGAQMKKPLTVADVMASKPVADPLRMLDCCLISDAAGAFIVTRPELAKDLKQKPIYLAGIGEYHTHEHVTFAPSLTEFGARQSSEDAYAMAGLKPSDVDLAQLYDCFTIVPVLELEEMGFCEKGEGGAFYEAGHAAIGGKLPINTHGGMLSHAHAGAAGGLFGIVESVRQLRGGLGERQVQGAEVALVHNEGGILSSHCTAILTNSPA